MHDLDVDLDDAGPDDRPDGATDALPPPRRRWRAAVVLPVAGCLAAALVAVGAVVVPLLVPKPVPPSVTVDDVTDLVFPDHPVVDLHEDADGRPVGPATVTLQVVLRVTAVPAGLHGRVVVLAPTGPGVGPGEKAGPAVAVAVGAHTLGALTFTLSCTTPGAARPGPYAVPVTFGRDGDRTLAAGTLRDSIRGVVDEVCAARELRDTLGVVAVAPVRDRAAVRLTVENRGTRTATLDWVLGDPSAMGQAPPGTSAYVVPVTPTVCLVAGVGPDGRTVQDGSATPTDDGLGLVGGIPTSGSGRMQLSPVVFTAAAKASYLPALRQACVTRR